MKYIDTLLQSSGWTSEVAETDIASSGTAKSVLSASSVTRTRKAHQITASCLYKVLKDAFGYFCNEADTNARTIFLRTGARSALRESTAPFLALSAFNGILSLVRAFRKANFTLYC